MLFNQPQIEFWNGPAAQRWVAEQERLDRALGPFDDLCLERARPRDGERVIDLGCGCGASTLRLAERVGPKGQVLGVDISAPMLARARERARSMPWVGFHEGDAAEHRFAGDADLLYSRFGSMFFVDPGAAFANLRKALRPSGRVCIVCWCSAEDNPWYVVPLRAAETVVPPLPPAEPGAPGPFSFADDARLREVLKSAGFTGVQIERCDTRICTSSTGLAEGVEFSVRAGPLARIMVEVGVDTAARVRSAIADALAEHVRDQRVELAASIWLATAHV
ncbi:MAG TPA: class I SAM-dependent methyltransferase [Polyangiaceae bacterium]|nr:class I SAM-dependent methyltransferase [Polyangiaceae bacterium]